MEATESSVQPSNATGLGLLPPELTDRIIKAITEKYPMDEQSLRAFSSISKAARNTYGALALNVILPLDRYQSGSGGTDNKNLIRWISVRKEELESGWNADDIRREDGDTARERLTRSRARTAVNLLHSLTQELPKLEGIVLTDSNHWDNRNQCAHYSFLINDRDTKGGVIHRNEDADSHFSIASIASTRQPADRDTTSDGHLTTYRFQDDRHTLSRIVSELQTLPLFHSIAFDTFDYTKGEIGNDRSDITAHNLILAQSTKHNELMRQPASVIKATPRYLKRLALRTDNNPTELAKSLQKFKFSDVDLCFVPRFKTDTLDPNEFPESLWDDLSRVEGIQSFKVKTSGIINEFRIHDMTDKLKEAKQARWAAEDRDVDTGVASSV